MTLRYVTLHYITLHYITLHYITLHYITSHYITLHYITFQGYNDIAYRGDTHTLALHKTQRTRTHQTYSNSEEGQTECLQSLETVDECFLSFPFRKVTNVLCGL